MRLACVASAFFGVLGFAVPALAQTPTTKTFQQDNNGYSGCMDTYVDKFDAKNGDDTFGGVERLEVRYWNGGATEYKVTYIMFDVTSIPTNATVTSAKLILYSIRARGQNGDVPVVEKLTGAWNGQNTFNMGFPTRVAAPGVTCPPIDSAYVDEPLTTPPNLPQVYTITGMASLVQGWMAMPGTNYGIMISCTTDINISWASSEYPIGGTFSPYRPALEVTYTVPGSGTPPTVSVSSPPSSTTSTPLAVSGTASATAPATVTSVTWSNALSGATGTATGTTLWSASIPLLTGSNAITMTVTDSYGLTNTATFTVIKSTPSASGGGGSTKRDKKFCGIGLAEGSANPLAIAAVALALLLAATVRRS
ncbi:MAG TPA: DNRLRE domain-containing protein [Planctomycetota bacterium]|nr:DNRLRE domain-containing protein [Planctomycetota bacterium]